MREFQCTQCGHTFKVMFCNGQRGWQLACPQCNSPVKRINLSKQNGSGRRKNNQKGKQFQSGSGRSGVVGCGRGLGRRQGLWPGSSIKNYKTNSNDGI